MTGVLLWVALQVVVAVAVLWANIYFQWTDNGMLAAAGAGLASYGVTAGIIRASDWLLSRCRPLPGKEDKPQHIPGETGPIFFPGEFSEDPGPAWIGNQPRNLIDVSPEPPALDNLKSLPGPRKPPAGGEGGGGSHR